MSLGFVVSKLHDFRMVCLLKAVTPRRATDTVAYAMAIDYSRYCDSIDVLQAKVKSLFSVGPACLVPRALNKHYAVCVEVTRVYFMYFNYGW